MGSILAQQAKHSVGKKVVNGNEVSNVWLKCIYCQERFPMYLTKSCANIANWLLLEPISMGNWINSAFQ